MTQKWFQNFKEKVISGSIINIEKDDKFEKERDTEYILLNLTKIYPDISPRLLRQTINRSQKTVVNKKYSLII